MNKLIIGGREFSSRLFVGTGKFSSNELMEKAIEASGSEMITVAMKRINMTQEATDDMLTHIDRNRVQFLPNTSGVRNAEEAVLAAQFSRECFGTDFVKLEIHPDPKYLLPNNWQNWDSWYFPIFKQTPYFVNGSKKSALPP